MPRVSVAVLSDTMHHIGFIVNLFRDVTLARLRVVGMEHNWPVVMTSLPCLTICKLPSPTERVLPVRSTPAGVRAENGGLSLGSFSLVGLATVAQRLPKDLAPGE